MRSKLLGNLISSGQLDVCQIQDHPKNTQGGPQQLCGFLLDYTQVEV